MATAPCPVCKNEAMLLGLAATAHLIDCESCGGVFPMTHMATIVVGGWNDERRRQLSKVLRTIDRPWPVGRVIGAGVSLDALLEWPRETIEATFNRQPGDRHDDDE